MVTIGLDSGTTLGTIGSFTFSDLDLTSPNNDVTVEVVSASPSDSNNYLSVYPDGTISYLRESQPGMSTWASKLGQIGPQMGQIWDFLRSVSVHFGS